MVDTMRHKVKNKLVAWFNVPQSNCSLISSYNENVSSALQPSRRSLVKDTNRSAAMLEMANR